VSHIHEDGSPRLSRREEALVLSEELLADIELDRIDPMALVRRTSRLARLLDDAPAMQWLSYEITGYPTNGLDTDAWSAATRSCRTYQTDDGPKANTQMLGAIYANLDAAKVDLIAGTGDTSDSQYAVVVENNKAARRAGLRGAITEARSVLDRVIGAIHGYVAERHAELRFGSAVETAFGVVRERVDAKIANLVPDGLPMISAAFENASSQNPEHWQSAAGTCRRLLMTAADRLRAPGPDIDGQKMGRGNYVNRLVDWISSQAESETAEKMIVADLQYLGPRLDAADAAGQKGAHDGPASVTRAQASRFVTGTYLVLGDILDFGDQGDDRELKAKQSTFSPQGHDETQVPPA
jgi:hypothetical protein